MNAKVFRILALLTILALLVPTAAIAQSPKPKFDPLGSGIGVSSPTDAVDLDKAIKMEDGRVRVIVELADPSLALYQGGIQGLAATSAQATGSPKLIVSSPASVAYIQYLEKVQKDFAGRLLSLAPSATVDFQYQVIFNGLSIAVNPSELDQIKKAGAVKAIYPDQLQTVEMDASLDLINAPEIWADLGGAANAGSGIYVAVIDTGIRSEHPMFAGTGFSMPASYPRGYCVTNPSDPDFQCNDKLVAARWYNPPFTVHPDEVPSPLDINGHGSHTAGTSAGNQVTIEAGAHVPTDTVISGVAPAAYLMVYKGLFHTPDGRGSGSDSMLLAALNDSVADGADVVNNSWGGGPGDPNGSPYQSSIQAMTAAGTVVVFSAGNSGPGPGTIGCPGCVEEAITVAASTTTRRYGNTLDAVAPLPVDEALTGLEIKAGSGPAITADLTALIEYSGAVDAANVTGCAAFPANSFDNHIALVQRGGCTFIVKVDNAAAAGADAVVIFNNAGDGLISMAVDGTTIPSYFTGQSNGELLRDWIVDTITSTARLNYSPSRFDVTPDVLADFSSVGPNGDPNVIKPDISAPGVDVLSAYSPAIGGQNYTQISGTSMAAPHVTGAAALMKQLHPDWSPAQIKTALTSTAVQTELLPDGLTPAGTFHMGSGRLDLDRARQAGVVFEKPSYGNGACLIHCEWQDRIKNVSSDTATWTATVTTDEGLEVTVSPSTFTLPASLSGDYKVMANVSALTPGEWYFGTIVWQDSSGQHPDAYLPLAVRGVESSLPSLVTKSASADTVKPGETFTYTISLTNILPFDNTFFVRDPLPENVTYVNGSATGGLAYDDTQKELTATVDLAGSSLLVVPGISPAGGYLPLSLFGTPPLPCTATCDDTIINLDIAPFKFTYNGQEYSTISMVTNGFAVPGGTTSAALNQFLPDPAAPNNTLAALWTDLDLDGGDGVGGGIWSAEILSDGVNLFLVMQWENAELFADATSVYSFQIWIQLDSSSIWYTYGLVSGDLSTTTVGAENDDGTVGDTVFYNGSGTAPAVGADWEVANVPGEDASFTFQVMADDDPAPENPQIINTVEVSHAAGSEVFLAWVETMIESMKVYFPMVFKSMGAP